MNPPLKKYFARHGGRIEKALIHYLPSTQERPRIIHEAMRYSVLAGGKRLRPILVIAGAELCGGKAADVMPAACALEFIHTYSLIHDDLPAMDDDDLRRGKPTNHKVYGEDIAILAGDALLTHAFSLLADNADVVRLVSHAAGTFGMVGGQVADIQADQGRWKKLQGTEYRSPKGLLQFIHLRKTAALIRASLVAGAILAGGKKAQIAALDNYGEHIGLLFQVTDDILDQIGDKKKLGKRGSDRANQKLTFPAIFGLERSQAIATALTKRAHQALSPFGQKADVLHHLADFILSRDH